MSNIIDDYAKELAMEKAMERCKDAILLGIPLDKILKLFGDLDEKLVRDLFEQFSSK